MPTTVTGTLVDKNGQTWAYATVQFIFQPPFESNDDYTLAGVPFVPGVPIVKTDASGAFSIVVPSNNEIEPANSRWDVVITPNATYQAFISNLYLTTGTLDLSALFTASANISGVQSIPLPRAYNDTEMAIPPNGGQLYYDTSLKAIKFWENSQWNIIASSNVVIGYPGAGIVVSTGSAWAASINPATLVQYPPAGLAVSTGTGWTTPIDPATLQGLISLTTNGNNGPATFANNVLNIPQYSGGAGGMVYPAAGIGVSDGTQWLASIPPSRVAYVDVLNTFTTNQQFNGSIKVNSDITNDGNVITHGALVSDRIDGLARLGWDYTNANANNGIATAEVARLRLTVNGQSGVSYAGEFTFGTASSRDTNVLNDVLVIRHNSAGPGNIGDPLVVLGGTGDLSVNIGAVFAGRGLTAGIMPTAYLATPRGYSTYIYNDPNNGLSSKHLSVGDGNSRGAVTLCGIGQGGLGFRDYATFVDGLTYLNDRVLVQGVLNLGGSSANTGCSVVADGTNTVINPAGNGAVYLNWERGNGVNFGGGSTAPSTLQANIDNNGHFAARKFSISGQSSWYWDGGSTFFNGAPNGRLLINQGISGAVVQVYGDLQVYSGNYFSPGGIGIQGNCNVGALQLQSTAPNGYVLTGDGSHYVPKLPTTGSVPSNPLNGERAFNVVYQNNTGSTIIVTGFGRTSGSGIGSVEARIGTGNPPNVTTWGLSSTATIQNGASAFCFVVPPGWFYGVYANTLTNTQGSAVNATGCWIETMLN